MLTLVTKNTHNIFKMPSWHIGNHMKGRFLWCCFIFHNRPVTTIRCHISSLQVVRKVWIKKKTRIDDPKISFQLVSGYRPVSEASAVSWTRTHRRSGSRAQSQHHCSMEHKTPVGCWPGFPVPSIQCDHVLDRRKQKRRGTVSTSDGADPNLATSRCGVQ